MNYAKGVTEVTLRQFINDISDRYYPMAGTIIAAQAAQATALAEACMQISLDQQVDKLNWQDVTERIEQMAHLKNTLLEWCNQDAAAIAEFMGRPEADDKAALQRTLCDSPSEVGQLAVAAAKILEDFRPQVYDQIRDDLEIALQLLAHAARSAMLVLDSNLRLWPEESLLAEYEPRRAELETKIDALSPVSRVR